MKITDLEIEGAKLIELEPYSDARGSFSRQFCMNELLEHGIDFQIKQCNLSLNAKKGTLRGMHYQLGDYPESKIVSCSKGKIFDVLVDIRKDSKTYLKWIGTELTETNGKMLYMPPGIAHGFVTLQDDSTVYYQLNEFFHAECYNGIRYDDPKVNIQWPIAENLIMCERDRNYKLI